MRHPELRDPAPTRPTIHLWIDGLVSSSNTEKCHLQFGHKELAQRKRGALG